jgi:hypothetical protein
LESNKKETGGVVSFKDWLSIFGDSKVKRDIIIIIIIMMLMEKK